MLQETIGVKSKKILQAKEKDINPGKEVSILVLAIQSI